MYTCLDLACLAYIELYIAIPIELFKDKININNYLVSYSMYILLILGVEFPEILWKLISKFFMRSTPMWSVVLQEQNNVTITIIDHVELMS